MKLLTNFKLYKPLIVYKFVLKLDLFHTKLKWQYVILALIFLVMINVVLANSLRDPFLDHVWQGDRDDPNHIGIAYNFWKHNSFERNFLGEWIYMDPYPEILDKFPEVQIEQGDKGPIFYIFLGTFYKIIDPHPSDLYLYASLFNTIISSSFIIIFFLFFYKKFNFKISILSSFVIVFLPYFEWMAIRATPMMLFSLFSLCALFFIKKRNLDYFLFGVFAALSHLTHPFGIFLGISYSVYLLSRKEFKGFLIVTITWISILSPWMVRNYYLFKNFGVGLYIPFSGTVSNLLSFLPTKSNYFFFQDYLPPSINLQDIVLNPFYIIVGAFTNFGFLYKMDLLILIMLLGIGLAFFNFDKFKSNFTKKIVLKSLIFFSVIVTSYILAFSYVSSMTVETDPTIQYVSNIIAFSMIFGIPIIFSTLMFKTKNTIFNQIPRFYSFILIFALINLIGYFYTAYWFDRVVPETRQLMFVIFIIVPISLVGLNSLLTKLCMNIPSKANPFYHFLSSIRNRIGLKNFVFVLLILILIPISYQLAEGLVIFINYPHLPEPEEVVTTNQFLTDKIPHDSIVMSNKPSTTSMRTGLSSISIYPSSYTSDAKSNLIEHFDIDYVVFYDVSNPVFNQLDELNTISNLIHAEFAFDLFYNLNDSYLFEIKPLTNNHILEKIDSYIEHQKYGWFVLSFDNVHRFYEKKISESEKNNELNRIREYENSLQKYTSSQLLLLQDITKSTLDIADEPISTDYITEIYGNVELLNEYYSDTIKQYSEKEYFDDAIKLQNKKISIQDSLNKIPEQIYIQTKNEIQSLFDQSKDKESLDHYYKIKRALKLQLNTLDKSSEFYDIANSKYFDLLREQGELLLSLGRYGDAETVYFDLLGENKFDALSWLQLGKIYENQQDYRKALNAYEFAQRLLPSLELSDKISELEDKL